MATKTDTDTDIGRHVFERAGLGKPPFRYAGMRECKYQACVGAPVQPGASCDYCGQGIMYACDIRSSDGRMFKVGCDCVARTGDAGLIAAYKASPEVRAMNRAKAASRDARNRDAWAAIMADPAAVSALKAAGEYASLTRVWPMCGAAGRARYLAAARKIIANH